MKNKIRNIIAISAVISASMAQLAYSESFSEAFAKAKASGLAEFSYNGSLFSTQTADEAANKVYGPFPVTVKGYTGSKTNSVAYTGQVARHVLHDSLKKLSSKGNMGDMMAYFQGSDTNLAIVAPASKEGFPIKQSSVNDISKGKNLSGKTYKGVINAWPGQMTGPEVLEFMIEKAATSSGGFDEATG